MPPIIYSVQERVVIIKQHAQGLSYRRIRDHFAAAYPDRPIPASSTIQDMVKKFDRTGQADPSAKKIERPGLQLSEEIKYNIYLTAEEFPKMPLSQIAQTFGVSKSTVHKLLRIQHYRAFKFQEHHEVLEIDTQNRMIFCESMTDMINEDPDLINRICFTDEATLVLAGAPNKQNTREWSRINPHRIIISRTQHPEKINVWAGTLGTTVIGPFFINGNLNGQKYLTLLQEHILPAIRAVGVDGPIWFQHDGAPAHSTLAVRTFLDEEFPGRWIGRGGPMPWPARSPDLSPLDFSFWGCLKNKLYSNGPIADLPALRNRVIEVTENFDENYTSNIHAGFYNRLGYCTAAEGRNFENIINQPI